ncbi:hypothetical protein BC830DRAFT_1133373 [Chytriomyces sp. MP71]|nr:hypothetical protein BC830DRAFT_1133373 [Chytriomyces sp. MP71]
MPPPFSPVRSAVLVFCCGSLVVLGVLYLHFPSSAIPSIHSRTLLKLPFRAASADPKVTDLAVLLVQGRELCVAWVAKKPSTGTSSTVVQIYDTPLAPIFNSSYSVDPSTLVTTRMRYRGAERIHGKLHLISISKFTPQDPSIAFLSYVIDGESYHFEAKIIAVPESKSVSAEETHGWDVNDLPLPSQRETMESESPTCLHADRSDLTDDSQMFQCGCVNFVAADASRDSCFHVGPAAISSRFILPGNMWISKFSYSFTRSLLYLRQLDASAYRLIPSKLVKKESDAGNLPSRLLSSPENAGPILEKDLHGSGVDSLVLTELYAEGDGQTILDIRSKTVTDDSFHFTVHLHHRPNPLAPWAMSTLLRRFEVLAQLDELPVRYDDFYFLSNPVAAVSRGGRCAMWVYKGTVHILDWVGSDALKEGAAHGFTLTKSKLVKSLQSNVRVRGLVVADDGLMGVLVTDTDSIITIKRNFTIRERPEPPADSDRDQSQDTLVAESPVASPSANAEASADAFFASPFEVSFLFDAQPSISQIRAQPPTAPGTKTGEISMQLQDSLERGRWRLDSLWNAELLNEATVRADNVSIVSLALLPKPSVKVDNEVEPPTLLGVLFSNDVLFVLNLDSHHDGSFLRSFVQEKWKMFAGMFFVIAWFTYKEFSFSQRDAALRAVFFPPPPAAVVESDGARARALDGALTTNTNEATDASSQDVFPTPTADRRN